MKEKKYLRRNAEPFIIGSTWSRDREKIALIFLPGLTADHRLFEKQIEFFERKYNVLVWDAPGHAKSWPFNLIFP